MMISELTIMIRKITATPMANPPIKNKDICLFLLRRSAMSVGPNGH